MGKGQSTFQTSSIKPYDMIYFIIENLDAKKQINK